MTDVKISSYNIHSCVGTDGKYSVERVTRVIRDGGASIICIQETEVNDIYLQNRVWSSTHGDNQPSIIATMVGFHYHVFVPAIKSRASSRSKEIHGDAYNIDVSGNFSDGQSEGKFTQPLQQRRRDDMGKFGIAILSKYPILQVQTHQYKRYKHKTIRNAMACLISLPNNKFLWIVNTHLGCHFIGKEQQQQAKELIVFINSLAMNRPENILGIVLCGDLNCPPWYQSVRTTIQQSGLHDTISLTHGPRSGYGTFPSSSRLLGIPTCFFRKLLRLDYIFVRELPERRLLFCRFVGVQDDSSICSLASDHLPICAMFTIG